MAENGDICEEAPGGIVVDMVSDDDDVDALALDDCLFSLNVNKMLAFLLFNDLGWLGVAVIVSYCWLVLSIFGETLLSMSLSKNIIIILFFFCKQNKTRFFNWYAWLIKLYD